MRVSQMAPAAAQPGDARRAACGVERVRQGGLVLTPVLGLGMRLAYRGRRFLWRLAGHRPAGVHGIVLAADGRVVLVRLRYAAGWHVPGGGLKRGEAPEAGLLRELREEIGLHAWSSVHPLGARARPGDAGQGDDDRVFIVRDAAWRPAWSLEIAEVAAFDPAGLPRDVTPWTRAALARAGLHAAAGPADTRR